ncbi:MAG: PKD domain-containing protein, partial [Odoribacter sp.]
GCLESGVDTFYVSMNNHLGNPPGTKYSVTVRKGSDFPGKDCWKIEQDPLFLRDSAMVIFNGPTGILGADIRFNMTYQDDPLSIYKKVNTTDWKSVQVYKTPNLREIFNFRDSLNKDESIDAFKKIEVCSGENLVEIRYDSLTNLKYMYADGLPVYRSRYNFDVDYFRKDSIAEVNWKDVTQDTAMVDTSRMIFKYPGFYKIKIVAFNECGLDSLNTDSIKRKDEKRHFVVFQSGAEIRCKSEDTICGISNSGVPIAFVDLGKRFDWDPAPEYTFYINRTLNGIPDKDSVKLKSDPEILFYKNGLIEQGVQVGDMIGCDSASLKIQLYEAGTYTINIKRTRHCEPFTNYTYTVTIGDIPKLPVDTLWKNLGTAKNIPFYHCDTFKYSLPDIRIDSNNMDIDSIQWCFQKGTNLDTLYRTYGTEQIYTFDSIGERKNYMILKAHNFCGWSNPEEATLYTNQTPNVTLWRNFIPQNDSLCLGINYKYHWDGILPEHYKIIGKWTVRTAINNSPIEAGESAWLASTESENSIPKIGEVRFSTMQEKVYETFIIKNANNLECKQEIKDSVVILAIPEMISYTDTIRHCADYPVLDTKDLFQHTPPQFKFVEWKWNSNPAVVYPLADYKQTFPLDAAKIDTLYIKTAYSKGCYVKDTIKLEPQTIPELHLLEKNKTVCADTTIHYPDFLNTTTINTNVGALGIYLKVYQDKILDDNVLYDTIASGKIKKNLILNHQSQDKVQMIYEIHNNRVTTGFGGCVQRDTMEVKVWKPVVSIIGKDTLANTNLNEYNFGQTGSAVQIDTADIENQQITWKALKGTGSMADLHHLKTVYSLSADDKKQDSLQFELSGSTPCGKILQDTLTVYLPKEKLWAHSDTICSIDQGYTLWGITGKTYGEFINTQNLKWTILSNKENLNLGSVNPNSGCDAKYIPSSDAWKADTIKIQIEAWNLYDVSSSGKSLLDTVFLKVNRAPEDIYPDTLYMKAETENDRWIDFDDIAVFKKGITNKTEAYSSQINWEWIRGDGEGSGLYPNDPTKLNIGTPPTDSNYLTHLKVIYTGDKGCQDKTKDVTLVGVMPPIVTVSNFDLCAGGSVVVDTGYQIIAKDRFTTLTWSSNGKGYFVDNNSQYQSIETDNVTQFVLTVKKNFTLYTNQPASYTKNNTGQVHTYGEPTIDLTDGAGNSLKYDTLCVNITPYTYQRDWVNGNFSTGNYTKENLITTKSKGLTGSFPNFTLNEGVDQAELIVSTNFGTCKKWENKADTLFLTRLKTMNGGFTVPSESGICAGSSFTITQITTDPTCKNYTWSATGGTIDQTDLTHPFFTSTTPGTGTISLIMTPPHGCPSSPITKEFKMIEKPVLTLSDATICAHSNLIIPFTLLGQVDQIQWTANGRLFATTTTESSVEYTFNPNDVVNGTISIIGKITPQSPCSEIIFSPMTITVQEEPIFSGTFTKEICQGDTLKLSPDIISVTNQGNILWSVNANDGTVKDLETLNTYYVPGEISGEHRLNITAQGLNGCLPVSKTVKVTIDKSEQPEITVPNILCMQEEISFTNNLEATTEKRAIWKVDHIEKGREWGQLRTTFTAAGRYNIYLETTFNNICPRHITQDITIDALPATNFKSTPDSIVGSGKEIIFENLTPGTITRQWDAKGQGTMISDEGEIYKHRYDLINEPVLFPEITLTVTNGNGCSASKNKTLKIVTAPTAKFNKTFNKCTGEITFQNLSEGENVSYTWNLGNGTSKEDTIPKNIVYTPLYHDSTYYISLKVTNEGGESIYKDSVKVISKLNPTFEILPENGGCEGSQLFSNRTKGEAERYTFNWGDGSQNQSFSDFFAHPISHTFINSDTVTKKFIIQLTAENKCSSILYKDSVRIYPNTTYIGFIPTEIEKCFGNEITFRNKSFGFRPDAQVWWCIGSDHIKENSNPIMIHHFDKPGTYPVKLVMKDQCHTDTSEIIDIHILGDLSLAFTIEEGPYCTGQSIEMKTLPELKHKFTDLRWDFGDAHIENDIDSVRKIYQDPHLYDIHLSAKSVPDGCPITTKKQSITVHQTPFAAIQPTATLSGCAPYTVAQFTRVGNGNEQIFWDFKNGDTSTEVAVPNVTFKDPGQYPIFLRLTSEESGCIDTASKIITVLTTPRPQFTISDSLFCTSDGNISIALNNQTPQADLSTFQWFYNHQPQPFSIERQPAENLELTGVFDSVRMTLRATNISTNCSAEYRRWAISGKQVKTAISMDTTACFGESMLFQNSSKNHDQIEWDLGDGAQRTIDTFTYQYDSPGKYSLEIKAHNKAGCSDTLTRWIIVYPLPEADFTFSDVNVISTDLKLPAGIDISKLPNVPNGAVEFTDHSTVDAYPFADNHLDVFWNFGDDSEIKMLHQLTHTFKNNGQYTVKLLTESLYGCADSMSQIVSIAAVKGLFIPNAFAPEAGETENPGVALFQPKGIGLLTYKIQIYDGWGTCIWSSALLQDGHPAESWNGTFNGKPLPKGVYRWEANA